MDPQLVAVGGVIASLAVVVGRLLASESPYRKMNQDLEDDATDYRVRIRRLQDDVDMWRTRAIDAGWRPDHD